jgi:hypothetical protein
MTVLDAMKGLAGSLPFDASYTSQSVQILSLNGLADQTSPDMIFFWVVEVDDKPVTGLELRGEEGRARVRERNN